MASQYRQVVVTLIEGASLVSRKFPKSFVYLADDQRLNADLTSGTWAGKLQTDHWPLFWSGSRSGPKAAGRHLEAFFDAS